MERPTCKTCPYYDAKAKIEVPQFMPYTSSASPRMETLVGGCKLNPGIIYKTPDDFCGNHPDFPAYIASMKEITIENHNHSSQENEWKWKPISMALGIRTGKVLFYQAGIISFEQLSRMTAKQILKIDGIGHGSLKDIVAQLKHRGMELAEWDPIPREHEHNEMRRIKQELLASMPARCGID